MQIRSSLPDDLDAVLALYRRVARVPGGLARLEPEVSREYVAGFLASAHSRGISLVAQAQDGHLLGEIHAYTPGLFCFAHVLSELTIAVDPAAQGLGLGRQLFERFMATVRDERPDVLRVELIARESNARAIGFYEKLGFRREGVFAGRIRNVDGSLESDIPMAWIREEAWIRKDG
ncbi:MAG: N-acetyltransferase family protein [Pseudomonadales bacterium]